jgi:hypothetical protein
MIPERLGGTSLIGRNRVQTYTFHILVWRLSLALLGALSSDERRGTDVETAGEFADVINRELSLTLQNL